jgi:hypothetical protein
MHNNPFAQLTIPFMKAGTPCTKQGTASLMTGVMRTIPEHER